MHSLLNRNLLSLALGHFVVDLNANLLPVMLPFVRASLGLSYAETGLIMTAFSLSSSLAQPVCGYIADRVGSRWLVVLPIAWMVVFMGLSGVVPGYLPLVGFVTLAGLGSAAYHPQGAAIARRQAGANVATAVSVYSLGGIAGYSLGPLIGALAFTALGLGATSLFVVPGLVAVGVMSLGLSRQASRPTPRSAATESKLARPVPYLALAALLLAVVARGWVEYGIVSYTPLRFAGELMRSSQLLFVFLFGEALGTFAGGLIADRFGRRRVIVISFLLLAPAVFLYNSLDGVGLYAVAAFGGLLLGSSVPVTIVMAQEALPRNVGMASGLMMGFAFGVAGIGVTINGLIADHYGLATSLALLALLPLVGSLVALTLPRAMEGEDPRGRRPSGESAKPAASAR